MTDIETPNKTRITAYRYSSPKNEILTLLIFSHPRIVSFVDHKTRCKSDCSCCFFHISEKFKVYITYVLYSTHLCDLNMHIYKLTSSGNLHNIICVPWKKEKTMRVSKCSLLVNYPFKLANAACYTE